MHVNDAFIKFRHAVAFQQVEPLQLPKAAETVDYLPPKSQQHVFVKKVKIYPRLNVACSMRSGVVQVPMHSHEY